MNIIDITYSKGGLEFLTFDISVMELTGLQKQFFENHASSVQTTQPPQQQCISISFSEV